MTKPEDNYGFRFKDWDIYKDARVLRIDLQKLLKKLPKEEQFALVDQTRRSLLSIVLNIAEGSKKNSDKDTRLYINRAQTSLDEVIACLDCALDNQYITREEYDHALTQGSSLAKRLQGFNTYLKP